MSIRNWIATLYILTAAPAIADVVITQGPGNFENDENVLFNEEGLLSQGLVVQGVTNQTGLVVNVYGAGESLITPSGGQARVEAEDGFFTDLSVAMDSSPYSIATLIWNINADADGQVQFTVARTGGPNTVATFDIDGGGENWFMFEAVGESMTSVSLSANVDIEDVRQIRLGAVPEPASMTALALGVACLVARHRRKRRS